MVTSESQLKILDFLTSIDMDSIALESCRRYDAKTTNTSRHSHNTLELSYFLKGEQIISLNDKTIESRVYDLVGYQPGCEHQGVLTPQEVLTIKLDIKYRSLVQGCSFQLRDKSGIIRWLFEQIDYEHSNKRVGSDRMIRNYAENIILHIIRHYKTASNVSLQETFYELLHYITHNCSLDITLEQMASIMNVSKSYLHKVFRTYTGSTPLHYLNEARINYAKKLLTSTDASIQDVSYAAGFNDSRYFSRVFKQVTNQSPSTWKKNSQLII
ncbi:helix-turn-helix domain-containing protein [Paenibacillus beijingensis]|uniref:HTH araC/xylS-type domain-containing protein n=1 Tax=Paenibacillus beijingensis TaxID=1126833 RepID=A0A0D5NJH0_9BACL|nr:helix-turn-helix domain-containing protein [Paenibacillus beijingensis]AJY75083.1 hypothetical protein VN24_11460 [Paenibacillus beijingensis]